MFKMKKKKIITNRLFNAEAKVKQSFGWSSFLCGTDDNFLYILQTFYL